MVEKFDREKFKALAHYIIWRAGRNDGFGATKLNKVLWFADARQYTLRGRSITGAQYTKQEFGPVPRAIMPVRNELEKEGAIRVIPQRRQYETTTFISLVPPSADLFDSEELASVEYWIENISKNHTATSISEESHDYGWEIAAIGEALPFTALLAFRVREEPTDAALDWARNRAVELGLA